MTTDLHNDASMPTHRSRIGISISAANGPELIDMIVAAEAAGVEQLWMTQGPGTPDALVAYAVALTRTERIRLGTSIVPTYPRHPLALAQQATTAAAFGPQRLRLGVGPSHRPIIEGMYGLALDAPLAHLEEYVGVLRAALWEGKIDHQGRFFKVKATLPTAPRIPLLVSALGEKAFRLAGGISDGAISWNCPVSYLHDVALPALRAGAEDAGRPTPPLVAHSWVALSTDIAAVRAAARQRLATYARLPFYATMFANAGFPVVDGQVSDALIDALVVMGDEATVRSRIGALLDAGLDELLLTNVGVADAAAELQQLFALVGTFGAS